MAEQPRIVIVGAGLAAASAAEALREESHRGPIVMIGEERELPYERPPLSKGYLAGETPREEAQVKDAAFYAEAGIDLRPGERAESIDLAESRVILAGGEAEPFDRLLLATGATSRRLSLPGADLEGVHYLRDLGDADALREELAPGRRLAIVGGGWIGAEVAATARGRGAEVDLFERDGVMLGAVLGEELGTLFEGLHREKGVRVRARVAVEGFEGEAGIEGVRLAGGEVVACDAALIAIGAVPADELAEAAGIEVSGGVLVDERLESSAPGVFAAGDVANAMRGGPVGGRRVRVEHWANAIEQGKRAARAMLGLEPGVEPLPYFFTDQYDLGMEYTGDAAGADELVIRGDRASRELIAFWLREGRVLAGMNVNVWDVTDDIGALIRSRAQVDRERLADPEVPLSELADAPASGAE